MVTRFRVGTNHSIWRLILHVSSVSPLPKSYTDAFNDPNWQNAMCDEYNALINNNTWTLVPRPADTNIVCCMWLFRHKYLVDGTLSRYKARFVANGSTHIAGIDVDETFSPVVTPGTIQTVLSLATFRHWRFIRWMSRMSSYMGTDTTYLLMYVDDIVLAASFETLFQQIISSLHQEFSMTDLSSLNYFLGISVTRDSSGMFLSERKYAFEILERDHMLNCNHSRTHVDTDSKLKNDGDPVSDPTLYLSLTGSLRMFKFPLLVVLTIKAVLLAATPPKFDRNHEEKSVEWGGSVVKGLATITLKGIRSQVRFLPSTVSSQPPKKGRLYLV
nr:ribonuclease H-like domain-containing protein [Tanacetum cinerariifolium]